MEILKEVILEFVCIILERRKRTDDLGRGYYLDVVEAWLKGTTWLEDKANEKGWSQHLRELGCICCHHGAFEGF